MNRRLHQVLLLIAVPVSFMAAAAHADIPTGYKGTPYQGMPSAIPGRVELANMDLGGDGVAWHADHNRMNSAGYEPISGNDYRPTDKNLPNICKTNTASQDHWSIDGTVYPSPTDLYWYYMGYAHAHDWVRVTVDVKQTGTYTVSSNWASDGPKWGLSIWFNDGHSPIDPTHPTDGVNKTGLVEMDGTSDFHKWKAYPKFATVQLTAGLQVMTFHLEKYDHLQYGFLQFDLVGGGTTDGGTGTDAGGAAGAPGADAGAAGGAGGAITGDAGASGGTAGASGGTAGATGTSGAGGSGGSSVPVTGQAGATGAAGKHGSSSSGGCSFAPAPGADAGWSVAAGLLLLGCARLRRRRDPAA